MKRRQFIMLLGSTAAVWSLNTEAQDRLPVVGYLHFATPDYQPGAAELSQGTC